MTNGWNRKDWIVNSWVRYRYAAALLLMFFLAGYGSAAAPAEDESLEDRLSGLELRGIGPALMSGRIADIAIDPTDRSTWYVAVGSGGVWKTTNSAHTWTPVFDDQPSYSIGCVTIDPENPEVIWVGTGENVSGRHVGFGDGVYKSLNGGETWERMGLEKSEHIAEILVDPRDTNVAYVAAEGPLWSSGGERGVYKTEDGGQSWSRVLFISEDTGVTSLEFEPGNPDVLYAAAYQRRRPVWGFLAGGPESGIYKTEDGGGSWRELTEGLPKGDMGKIGLAVSPVDPQVVYATIEAGEEEKGFYRSLDAGGSWTHRNAYISGATGPHYYQEIYASPHHRDWVYQADVRIRMTKDGGETFELLGEPHKHSDNHALVFDSEDPGYLLVGSDGGLYETWDHAENWRFIPNLPITQFYKLDVDNDTPFYNVIGGTQDNNTQLGPVRTLNIHGIRNQDWIITLGGDGHGCKIDPEDPNIVYTEWQQGNLHRFDKRNGQKLDIKPQPGPDDPPERWNWDAPIEISPHLHTRLYFGSQRIWRSEDRGDSWTPISPDLTRNENRYELEILGRVWSVDALYDHYAMSLYNSTTSISESPLVEGLIYVGTDDGLIQVTEDGGENWRRIDALPGVPDRFYVNEVKASVLDPDTVFLAVDNHKTGDFAPYLFRSSDRGRTWVSISGDLPERHLVWSVEEDHEKEGLLFAGTEFGLFFTLNGGANWTQLEGGVPTISFRDIEIQRRENDLVAASFGRGFYVLDDYSMLREIEPAGMDAPRLFSVRESLLYVPEEPLGGGTKASQGADYFTAPNPPFGAVFSYYLPEDRWKLAEVRRNREKDLRKENEDIPFPGWDRLEEERRESGPQLKLTVRDSDGNLVRRVTAPHTEGFHRVAWDLRYPSFAPASLEREESSWRSADKGMLALPGAYRVTLEELRNGDVQVLAGPESFSVTALSVSSLPIQDREEVLQFQKETGDLYRKASGLDRHLEAVSRQLELMEQALLETPAEVQSLLVRWNELRSRTVELQRQLGGDSVREEWDEAVKPSILDRLTQIIVGHWETTYGPTQTHRRNLEIASSEFEMLRSELVDLESDLEELRQDLEELGAPWTPARVP